MLLFRNIVLALLLVWVSYTDLKRREIDNEPLIIGLTFVVLFTLCGFNDVSVRSSILGFLIGGVIFLILSFFGMGGGDVKLMAMIGFFVGWKHILLVMYGSFLIGALIGVIYLIAKKKGLKEHIPFAPAIACATMIVAFFGTRIINSYDFLWILR